MKIIKFFNHLGFLIIIFSLKFFLFTNVHAEKLKTIEIFGNERLADETIILFSNLEIGENINNDLINNTFKNLFQTDYFKDLKITFDSGNIKITVIENPILQEIKINGVKNKSLLKELEKITRKSEKYPFIEANILNQKNLLNNIVRVNGISIKFNFLF